MDFEFKESEYVIKVKGNGSLLGVPEIDPQNMYIPTKDLFIIKKLIDKAVRELLR